MIGNKYPSSLSIDVDWLGRKITEINLYRLKSPNCFATRYKKSAAKLLLNVALSTVLAFWP
ncbi:hypothetical protein SPHINGOT1_120301 [Sphingomonas sp. T1]|nr:hypothetical protein SPHINGOT1_120301 [Sphingomonas sp. T1]